MVNIDLLKSVITESGMTLKAISDKSGIARPTLYNRLNGNSEFNATEIVALTETLRLTKQQRDNIFLVKSVL